MVNNPRTFLTIALLLFISTSCTSNNKQYDSINAPLIEAELLFKIEDNEEILFGWISDVLMTSKGDILVADVTRKKIHRFKEDGEFGGVYLSEGRGPGEVQRMAGNISITDDDNVLLFDSAFRRVSLYELTDNNLNVIRDINLEPFPSHFYLTSENKLILYVTPSFRPEGDPNDRIVVANLNGEITNEKLMQFKPNEQLVIYNESGQPLMTTSSPHHSRNLISISNDKLVYNRSDEIGFKIFDLITGEKVVETFLNRPDQSLSSDERRAFVDDLVERVGAGENQKQQLVSEMPNTKGKVRMLKHDNFRGHIWLNIVDNNEYDWLIFTESGDLVATFNQNFDGHIFRIQNGRIFVSTENEDGAPILKVLQHNLNE
jgi:hypothetical protein